MGISSSQGVIATPEYVTAILQRNRKLWSLYAKDRTAFNQHLEEWTNSIRERFKELYRKKPDVSVVIPAYNEEEHILTVLESLASQKVDISMEVIVVANNCKKTDKTAQIARSCGARVIEYHLINKQYKPIPYARQVGLEQSRGAIIASTDADTIAMPSWIQALYNELETHTDVGFSTSHSLLYDQEKFRKVLESDKQRRFMRETFDWTGLIGLGNNMAFRKKEALKLGGYNLHIYPAEDTELGLKLSLFQQKKTKLIKKPQAVIWMSPRRVKQFGADWLFSHLNLEGRILDARESFKNQ